MKIIRFFLIVFIALLINACEPFVTGIDEADITRVTDVELKLVVVAGAVNYMGTLEGEAARLAGMWSGYFFGAARQYTGQHQYNVVAGNSNLMWENVFSWTLRSLRIARGKALALEAKSTVGMCQVMEASLMASAAATWGDIPYRQAIDVDNFPDPAYDPQVQVVDDLIVLTDEAIINLTTGTETRIGDFFYLGGNAQWIAVANSLKARLLLYKKDYANALIAANAGVQLPVNDLLAKHGSTFNSDQNVYNQFLTINRPGDMTAANTFLGSLINATATGNRNHVKTNEAARLTKYYSGNSVANYVPNASASGYFAVNATFPLHSAFETKLIAAECLIRLGDFANALIKLNEHRANLRTVYPTGTYTNFVATDFDPSGIENVSGALTPNDALLREILEEKYVCLYGQIEGFNEIRRTNNALGIPPNVGTEIPQRFLYSQTEINANSSTPNPIPGLFEKVAIFK
jgi:hypothetical protein